ncbi:RH-like protein [Hemicordylus capensis]|uniref:RH-like protein n=1 Tax=Hemicordylus capensis TaxID=884348 RepID=UPI0023028C95|nr:RH-like protein [Hemicordylus capensis]
MAFQDPPSLRISLPIFLLFLEIAFILIFAFFVEYDDQEDLSIYPAFQDVNVMVMVGFSFLLAFLKRYGFSSVGFNLLLAALGVQWAVLVNGFFFHFSDGSVMINLHSILAALMSVTTVLVSVGAVLGKASPIQLTWMAVMELTVFIANRWIAVHFLQIENHLSLMHVHLFGACFGLMVSWFLYHPLLSSRVERERSSRVSDLLAMLGSLFLWMFWPSFNSALVENTVMNQKLRAVCNTYFAIVASTVAAFSLSVATSRIGKFSMAHIHNGMLAGGAAIGFSAPIIQHPWIAIALGLGAGTISVVGLAFIQKRLDPAFRIHDTCGVLYTFGLPSLLGGIAHIIISINDHGGSISVVGYAALLEFGALSLSISMGLVAGFFTGLFLMNPLWKAPPETNPFDDQAYWEFPHLAAGY